MGNLMSLCAAHHNPISARQRWAGEPVQLPPLPAALVLSVTPYCARPGGGEGGIMVSMQIARLTLSAAILIAVTASLTDLRSAPVAHANGGPDFSLRNFDYTRDAYLENIGHGAQDFVNVHEWRVTVCTPDPARLRIRAIVDFGTEQFRFVRRQPAGCTRHRLRGESDEYPEGFTESRLRIAWRNQRLRTRLLSANDPAAE
jgi:hypothetical protein